MGQISNTETYGNIADWIPIPGEVTTLFLVGDTHDWGINTSEPTGDANIRQVSALNGMPGRVHPLGGVIEAPQMVVQLGDFKHEDFGTVDRIASYYAPDGGGLVRHRCAVLDGNHDRDDVRALIVARHGSLTWGMKIGRVWLQAMTENYIAPNNTFPPDPAQIAAIKATLLARPASEPKIVLVHRALSGGYGREWVGSNVEYLPGIFGTNDPGGVPTDSLTPFLDMVTTVPNVKMVIHGHDHYAQRYTIAGMRFFSPASVAQFPMDPPYSTTYPETFVVVRIGRDWIDVANYRFGFDLNRIWSPDVWEWTDAWSY